MTGPEEMAPGERLRNSLARGDLSLCLRVISARTPEIAFVARAAGFDALYVDLEHCTASFGEASAICATATALGLPSLVRIADRGDPAMTKLLDAGASGIIAPHVDTAEQAQAVVDACKFAPLGHRSASGPALQFGFATMSLIEQAARTNRSVVVVAMIETERAVQNSEAIAAVPGLDMLLIGSTDLSLELGVPGDVGAAVIESAYTTVAASCAKSTKALGVAGVSDPAIIQRYVDIGACFVSAGTDAGFLLAGARHRVAELRALGGRKEGITG